MARAVSEVLTESDVRDKLAHITAPTLIMHRRDCLFVSVAHGRYLAEHIAGSRYVELPGADSLCWVGETAPMLDEIEEFITGMRGGLDAERVLTTIVFADIAGSTQRAAELGDLRWHALLDNHTTWSGTNSSDSVVTRSTRSATDSSRCSPAPASRSIASSQSQASSRQAAWLEAPTAAAAPTGGSNAADTVNTLREMDITSNSTER